jgi:hypothetical protein
MELVVIGAFCMIWKIHIKMWFHSERNTLSSTADLKGGQGVDTRESFRLCQVLKRRYAAVQYDVIYLGVCCLSISQQNQTALRLSRRRNAPVFTLLHINLRSYRSGMSSETTSVIDQSLSLLSLFYKEIMSVDLPYVCCKGKAVPLHAMKAPGRRGGIAPTHSQPRQRWEWVVSITPRPRFTPGERTPGTHWIGGWVGGLQSRSGRRS